MASLRLKRGRNVPSVQVLKGGYDHIFSADAEKVIRVLEEFNEAFDADEKNRIRSYNNWENYFAVDGGQWTPQAKLRLNQQNKHAAQYNIIGPKVDALTGSLIAEEFDLDWLPIEGDANSLTKGVKTAYYADKELGNYDRSIEQVVKDAMIYLGVMKVSMSAKHNSLKNISMTRTDPGYVLFDPHWISDNDDDCMKAWEVHHMTPAEVLQKYGVTSPQIEQDIKNTALQGSSYQQQSNDPNVNIPMHQKGDLWRVIEFHWIEKINTTRLIGQKIDSISWVPFPITTDKKKLERFMIANKIDPNTIQEAPYEDRIHHVTTIAPELVPYQLLEDGISTIQIRRLPYIQLTTNRAYGVNKGIVDDLIDIQQTINKRESKLTDLISTAQGGGKMVNENLFTDPAAKERFRQRANDPSYVEFVDGDEMTGKQSIQYINSNEYPAQIINQLQRMWEIVDRVSKVPAALEAISENANESGVLFERKLQVARINTITIVNRVKDFRKKLAEAYYEQFQLSYNGPERTFKEGKNKIVLNRRVYNKQEGKFYVENRPDQIPRCRVVATESKSSPTKMAKDRAIYSELYNLSVQTNPQYASFFFELLLGTMDLDEDKKARLDELSALQQIRDKISIQTEITGQLAQGKGAMLQGMQADQQIQQLMQQLQGGGPPQGGPEQQEQLAEEDIPQEGDGNSIPEEDVEQPEPLPADQA